MWVSGHGLFLLGFSLFFPDLGGGGSVLLGFFSRGSSVEVCGAGLTTLAAASSSGRGIRWDLPCVHPLLGLEEFHLEHTLLRRENHVA